MLNQVILVGRLVRTPELLLTESGKKKSLITLAVSRPYKNQDGEYDTDFLDCTLWTGVAERTSEYCKTGDIIGVKGRLQTRLMENEDGIKYKKMEVIADRVTFLSSSKTEVNLEEYNDEMQDEGTTTNSEDEKKKEKDKKKKS